jgi:hypothetical protein
VLNQKRQVAYMGKFDDHLDESRVTERFVRDAVDALLEDRLVEVTETRQTGCDIEYE